MSGPKLMEDRLSEYFEHACERGELKIDDMHLAAMQFQELCKVGNLCEDGLQHHRQTD